MHRISSKNQTCSVRKRRTYTTTAPNNIYRWKEAKRTWSKTNSIIILRDSLALRCPLARLPFGVGLCVRLFMHLTALKSLYLRIIHSIIFWATVIWLTESDYILCLCVYVWKYFASKCFVGIMRSDRNETRGLSAAAFLIIIGFCKRTHAFNMYSVDMKWS